MLRSIIYIIVFVSFLYNGDVLIYSQEVINTSGGGQKTTGGSIDYSIGNVFYRCSYSSSGVITEGVHHLIEVTSNLPDPDSTIQIIIYPNPNDGILNLSSIMIQSLKYILIDMNGRIIQERLIDDITISIDIRYLPNSSYFLKIIDKSNKIIKTYKITKSQ